MNERDQSSFSISGVKMSLVGPWWFQLIEVLVVMGLAIWSIVWICSDAARRGKNGFLAFVFLFAASWPISLLWWLWLRPPLPKSPAAAPPPPPLPPKAP
ncbi:MAG TPA: hypothetical protein VGM54_03405 [Chthoniobacter sp.]